MFNDIKKMSTSIISEPPEAAIFMAHMFLGGHESTKEKPNPKPCVIRMNPLLQPELKNGEWTFPEGLPPDCHDDFVSLIKLDMDAVKEEEVLKIEKLGKWWTEDKAVNQSIRYKGKTLECLIGHKRFSEARADWLSRCAL
jgi:hypothetical protein